MAKPDFLEHLKEIRDRLTATDRAVLTVIFENGPMLPEEIVSKLGFPEQEVSDIIKVLMEENLVEIGIDWRVRIAARPFDPNRTAKMVWGLNLLLAKCGAVITGSHGFVFATITNVESAEPDELKMLGELGWRWSEFFNSWTFWLG